MSLRIFGECAHAFGNSSAATIPVVAAAPGQTLGLYRAVITASTSTNATFQDTAGVALSQTFPLGGIKQVVLNTQSNGDPWFLTAIGKGIQLAQSAAATIGFDVWTQVGSYPAGGLGGRPAVPVQVFIPTTWNPSDLVNVLLTNSNLTETTSPGQGSVRSVASISSAKYYLEITLGTGSGSAVIGIANASANLATVPTTGVSAAVCNGLGAIAINGGAQTGIPAFAANGICCIAVDIGASLIWFRNGAAGQWNGSGTANPATGAGGYSMSGLTGGASPLFVLAGATVAGLPTTANFGASAFSGAVPSGFTAGWGVLQ